MRHFKDFDYKLNEYLMDKNKSLRMQINYMLCRTQSMFEYTNLPDSIPSDIFELYIQTNGHAFFTKINDNYYILCGNYSGDLDMYNRYTEYMIINPALNISKSYKIDVDGIIVKNDTLELGLIPLLARYCTLLVENSISMRNASINARMLTIISAPDERTKQSAEIYQQKIINGDNSVIGENPFFNGIKSQSVTQNGKTISELIALHQYIKASMFNELGLDANYNMKKENISENEAALSDDFLLPYIDNMIKSRQDSLQKINKMFDLNISVKFASTWLTNEMENKKQQEIYETKDSAENDMYDVEDKFIDDINQTKTENDLV